MGKQVLHPDIKPPMKLPSDWHWLRCEKGIYIVQHDSGGIRIDVSTSIRTGEYRKPSIDWSPRCSQDIRHTAKFAKHLTEAAELAGRLYQAAKEARDE